MADENDVLSLPAAIAALTVSVLAAFVPAAIAMGFGVNGWFGAAIFVVFWIGALNIVDSIRKDTKRANSKACTETTSTQADNHTRH